jgi:two-component system phosphate regulon sensor histidine kinase PhoR
MSEKISSSIFYVAIISVLIAVISVSAILCTLWRRETVSELEERGGQLLNIYIQYGTDGLDSSAVGSMGYSVTDGGHQVYNYIGNGRSDSSLTAVLNRGSVSICLWTDAGYRGAYSMLIIIIFAASLVLVFVSSLRARHIVRPINEFVRSIDNDIITPESARIYPELEPLTSKITAQSRDSEYMRHEFTANVTHELKTPLTSISGYAEMISTGMARPNDVSRFAGIIQAESNRMLVLVNDIIELSRLDNCEKIENPEPVDLYTVAEECSDQLSSSAEKRDITISLQGQSTIVMGDEGKLWELIYNLADNAINYNRDGGSVVIIIGNKSVTVKDTGIGIPPEHQKRIFERFYRVDKSHSRMTGGTGLGLSIVKHIAEQHGARITVKSEINVGTEITVDFT